MLGTLPKHFSCMVASVYMRLKIELFAIAPTKSRPTTALGQAPGGGGGGCTLGISGWGCAAGTLEPLTYTRASSAEFSYPKLE